MIKAEESNQLDLVVYRDYSGELTDCYLPLFHVLHRWLSIHLFGRRVKARSKIGCPLKQIFAEISVVYGSTNVL